jgi:hypothetical protein
MITDQELNGRLNKTGIISPRFNIQVNQIKSWLNLLLPSREFGIIILVSLTLLYASANIFPSHLSKFLVTMFFLFLVVMHLFF